jgi:hypothetical protein
MFGTPSHIKTACSQTARHRPPTVPARPTAAAAAARAGTDQGSDRRAGQTPAADPITPHPSFVRSSVRLSRTAFISPISPPTRLTSHCKKRIECVEPVGAVA